MRTIAVDHGCAVVLVEQHVNLALGVADQTAVMNHGRIVLSSDAASLHAEPERIEQAYFGSPVASMMRS